jgi:uncharacterized protein
MNPGPSVALDGPADVPGLVVETHASVLVFHEEVVVKVKKPVSYAFVDFTSLAARRAACEEEVRCNRRLAPDVYLGVAQLTLPDPERVIDHAVVMRRLPAARCLEAMVRRGDPGVVPGLEELVRVLADFHTRAERSPAIDADADADAVTATWEALVVQATQFAGSVLDAATLSEADRLAHRFLSGRRTLFADRIDDGRVCDGHGDLQAADVFLLSDGPRVLDALEFDIHLRHLDVAADIAFLAMDLERLGAGDESLAFVRGYLTLTGDEFPDSLFHYYCAERALVRCVVSCLRAPASSDASELLALVTEHLRSGRVVLGVVSGLPGTGKSTLARAACRELGWPVLRSDVLRREIAGDAAMVAPPGKGAYGAATTDATYVRLLDLARGHLERGRSVILDATFADPRWRQAVQDLAEDSCCDLAVVEAGAQLATAERRASERMRAGEDASAADEDVVRYMAAGWTPWELSTPVDTTSDDPLGAVVAACEALREARPDIG